MDVDAATAAALGFPKLKYAWVERERRWLCRGIPREPVLSADRITDLYVTGARLRLREAVPLDGGAPLRRLTRKADVDARTRLLTSVYLDEAEFRLLRDLPGVRLCKTRHRLQPRDGAAFLSYDVFEGPLEGLVLAEAEFDTPRLSPPFRRRPLRAARSPPIRATAAPRSPARACPRADRLEPAYFGVSFRIAPSPSSVSR